MKFRNTHVMMPMFAVDKHASINQQIQRGKPQTHEFDGEVVPARYF